MKAFLKIILLCAFYSLQSGASAQSKAGKAVNNSIKDVDHATNETSSTINNATKTLGNARKLFTEISGKKSADKNQMTIVVSGIRFNDKRLESLERALKATKGARNVSKSLQSGIITITLKYRFDANSLWNKIPDQLREMYEPVEVADKTLLLDFVRHGKR